MKLKARLFLASLMLLFAAMSAAQAQAVKTIKGDADKPAAETREGKISSKLMLRDVPYRIVLPAGYDQATAKRYPVVYLLHGLTGSYSNWTERTSVRAYALEHSFILITVEGGNGWYSDSVTVPNDKYESYIVKELIPEIDAKYRTLADRDHRVIAGLSMGGYGSIKFGLKYPEMFSLVGSFSGALGAAGWNEKNAGAIAKTMDVTFGPDLGTDTRNANDVFKIVRDLTPERQKALPFIYLSCGTEDFLVANNRDFLGLLNEKKLPHEYREHPGGHDWKFWDDQVREFLALVDRRVKR